MRRASLALCGLLAVGTQAAIIGAPEAASAQKANPDGTEAPRSSIQMNRLGSGGSLRQQDLLRRANEGDVDAMVGLGYSYYVGRQPQNMASARKWFNLAADADDARALMGLGYLISLSYGGTRDLGEGKELLQRAALRGLPRATYILSVLEAKVPGSRKRAEARRLLTLAAQAGDYVAQNALGIEYELDGDVRNARIWYTAAVAGGSTVAQGNFVRLENATRSGKRAQFDRLRDGVADGDPSLVYELAVRYHKGDGVPRDLNEALRLYRQAAGLGHRGAEEILSLILSKPATETGQSFSPAWMIEVGAKIGGVSDRNDRAVSSLERPKRHEDLLEGLMDMVFETVPETGADTASSNVSTSAVAKSAAVPRPGTTEKFRK
jgi:TPR repeat protein